MRSSEQTLTKLLLTAAIVMMTVLLFSPTSSAQLPDYVYLSVNGDTASSTMTQGDSFFWASNCDLGATINWEIWYDVNGNSVIDQGTDVLINSENITDGHPQFENNPIPDGWTMSEAFKLGAEPGGYIFKATDISTDVSAQRVLTMIAMSSPPNQLTGTITVPGHPAPDPFLDNRFIFSESENGGGAYLGVTDNNGFYSINILGEETGNDFYIQPATVPGFVAPDMVMATVSGVVGGNDFTYTTATDSLWGYVKDYSANIINYEGNVRASRWEEGLEKQATTENGRYVIYFTDAELGQWELGVDEYMYVPNYMVPYSIPFDNSLTGSFQLDITLIEADAEFYVRITEEGGLPFNNYAIQLNLRYYKS